MVNMDRKFFYRSKSGLDFHHTLTHYKTPEEAVQRVEAHHTCEVFLLLNGSVQYVIEGQVYDVSPMDMVIIKQGEMHAMTMDATQPYERMVLHFPPDLFPALSDLDAFAPFNAAKSFAHIIPKIFVEKYELDKCMKKIKARDVLCAMEY